VCAFGKLSEYASNCIDPIVHRADDLRAEVYSTSHWWKNLGKETIIMSATSVRILPTTICNEHSARALVTGCDVLGSPVLSRTRERHIPPFYALEISPWPIYPRI
jgi:hypothetical protein